MICGILEQENVVQVGDKTRISALKSFVTKGEQAIDKVEIKPEASGSFIDVTGSDQSEWFLDWVYTGVSRSVIVSVKITTAGATPTNETFTKTLEVVTEADDKLFSSDKDLIALEPDILQWVPVGRASWLNVHRAAQEKIMDAINKMGIINRVTKDPLTKDAFIDLDEVRFWSRDLTLALIYKSCQNAVDDVFSEKAKHYFAEAAKATNRARLRLDTNDDGEAESSEAIGMTSANLVRQ